MDRTQLKMANLTELAEKHGITLMMLFGSQVRGKTHQKSDVDIAFSSRKRLRPQEVAALAFGLSPIFGTAAIDLVDLRDAGPILLKRIGLEAEMLYAENATAFPLFRIYALKRYMETGRLRALRERNLNAFIHEHARP